VRGIWPPKGPGGRRVLLALGAALVLAWAGTSALGAGGELGHYRSLGKCKLFPRPAVAADAPSVANESAWRQDISAAPVRSDSAAIVSYIDSHGGDHLHPDFGSPREYGFPYAVVGRGAKRTRIHFTAYESESTHGRYRVPGRSPVEGGAGSDGDRHVLVVDRARCRLYELYRAFFRKDPRRHWDADSGVIWKLRSTRLRHDGFTSADAAGLPIFPGLVRLDEVRRGAIKHAIRITFDSTQNAWIHPASHCAGDTSDPDAPPMGLRLRLRADYDLSGFNGAARVIGVALKHYGVITADNGSNWFFSGTSDHRWDDENLNRLKSIPGSAFQVVRSAVPVHHC
jgi:hypothetical protein